MARKVGAAIGRACSSAYLWCERWAHPPNHRDQGSGVGSGAHGESSAVDGGTAQPGGGSMRSLEPNG